jgi:cysteine-rich repeat protein
MRRPAWNASTVRACILVLLPLLLARSAAGVDLGGVYVSVAQPFDVPCTLTFTQTGSALTITGPCEFGYPNNYVFDLAGTVDEVTGAFSTSGVLIGLCEDPGEVTMIGSGDGEVFTAATACGTLTGSIAGTKCNNGVLDASEDCEDGNTAAGDCCSPTCQFDAAGAACTPDTNSCTPDVCDGAGQCQHLVDPGANGMPCASDANPCTDDICNASGECTHPATTDPCDDFNPCTTQDTCAAGTCVGGPLAPECAGSIDLTGEWEITSSQTGLGAGVARHFVQTGGVLESTDTFSGMSGIGAVNPATGAFAAQTPFTALLYPCLELIVGTATSDAQEFSGNVTSHCGLAGSFGPYTVSGRRCDPVIGCACAAGAACTESDTTSHFSAAVDRSGVRTRWRWGESLRMLNLGDPTMGSDYRVCMETAAGSFVEVALHGSKWRKTRAGFRYSDPGGPIRRLWLKEKDNVAFLPSRVSFAMSLAPTAFPALPLTTPVRLRLVRVGAFPACFEATFANPAVNSPRRFLATE